MAEGSDVGLSLQEVTAQVDWNLLPQKGTVGVFVTGHQFPGEGALKKFQADCGPILEVLREEAKGRGLGLKTYSCLAQGTDQIFAQASLDLQIPLVGIIPCAAYKLTMPKGGPREAYLEMRRKGKDAGLMTEIKPRKFRAPTGRAFMRASEVGIQKAHLVMAVWNGEAALNHGATGDVVRHAMRLRKPVLWMDSSRLGWFPVSSNEWLNSIR